jgi:hypothetical protein
MDFNDLSRAEHVEMFKREMWDFREEIDPQSIFNWVDLGLGWALGKGMDIEEAKDFAIHIHYHENLS